jgi:hypothetical protein
VMHLGLRENEHLDQDLHRVQLDTSVNQMT